MLTALTWFTPDQLEWAGLAAIITGCFISAQLFVTFYRRWRAAGTELERQLTVDEHAAPPLTFTCPQCQPWGHPPCTCAEDCRHGDCRGGDCTTLGATISPADVRWLASLDHPKPAPRRRAWRGKRKAGTR
jgi:hypothetical protein